MLKGLIFDMDGTITFTENLHHKAYGEVFKKYGISVSFEDHIKKYAGSGARTIFSTVLKEKGIEVTPEQLEGLIKSKKEVYKKIVQESEIKTVPGVHEFLKRTENKGFERIIATGNSDLEVVSLILKRVNLDSYFPKLISITEVPRGKPFPDVFLEAAKRINCSTQECVVFEDAINGVTAAKAAGIRCIAFATTAQPEELLKVGAAVVLPDFTQLTDQVLYV